MTAAPEPTPVPVMRVITRLNIGGPARQALLLSAKLRPDYSTTLVAGSPSASEGELADPDIPVLRVPLVRPIRPTSDVRALTALRAAVRRQRPRVVHTHMAKAGTLGRIATLSSRLPRRPLLVHTFHGHVLEGYFRPSVGRTLLEVERRLAPHTDALVAVSPEIRDQLLDLEIGRPSQWRVIPLGLDLEPFLNVRQPSGGLRKQLGLDGSVPLIGAVGRLVPIKNLGMLLRAAVELPEVHVALIGDGESRSELEELARQLSMAHRVHFTGWWPDIPGAFSDLDVVALTSHNEGTPVSLIEALASGRPVVATDVGGVRFVLRDGRHGALTADGDVTAFSSVLADTLRQRPGREDARADMADRFGAGRLVRDIRDLYAELLGW